MKDYIIVFIALVIAGGIAYGAWAIKREFNYSFDYEDKVVETIENKYENRIKALEDRVLVLESVK